MMDKFDQEVEALLPFEFELHRAYRPAVAARLRADGEKVAKLSDALTASELNNRDADSVIETLEKQLAEARELLDSASLEYHYGMWWSRVNDWLVANKELSE